MDGLSNVTSASAREAVRKHLVSFSSGERTDSGAASSDLIASLGKDFYLNALAELTQADDIDIRIMACGFIIHHDGIGPGTATASRTLHEIVQKGNHGQQAMAAYWLYFTHAATPELMPALADAMRDRPMDDVGTLWMAAATLQASRPELGEAEIFNNARSVMLTALHSDSPDLVLTASRCLAAYGLHLPEVRSRLQGVFEIAIPLYRQQIIEIYGVFGTWTDDDINFLVHQARGRDVDQEVRIAAILAMAEIRTRSRSIENVLFQLLDDPSSCIVSMATAATFVRIRQFPERVVERLISFLSHADREFRHLAAERLADAGESIELAIPTLLAQLERETDDDVATRIILTLSAAGVRVLPRIEQILAATGMLTAPRFAGVLFGIAAKAPREVVALLHSPHAIVREHISFVLQVMGPDAAIALDIIIPILDGDDLEVLGNVLIAMERMRSNARAAAPRLGRLLLHESEFIRESAANAIVAIGFEAIPALRQLQESVPADEYHAIAAVLQRLGHAPVPSATASPSGVLGITNRKQLELFAMIGDILSECGALSYRDLAQEIEDRVEDTPQEGRFSSSASNLRIQIKGLEESLSTGKLVPVILIERLANKKGGLTPEGISFYKRVKRFFADAPDAGEGTNG